MSGKDWSDFLQEQAGLNRILTGIGTILVTDLLGLATFGQNSFRSGYDWLKNSFGKSQSKIKKLIPNKLLV